MKRRDVENGKRFRYLSSEYRDPNSIWVARYAQDLTVRGTPYQRWPDAEVELVEESE